MPPNNKDEMYNCDELEAPAFLNNELFEKVLKKCEHCEQLKVKNVKLTPASQRGDHFASIMFRASVEFELKGAVKSKSIIIKTLPVVEGFKMDLVQDSFIFETEIGMYTEVLPKFEKILKSIGDETVLAASILYHSLSPHKVIMFEDLAPQGYEIVRGRAVSEEELKAAYSKLAKWNAVSYKLALEQPEYFDKYRYNVATIPNMIESDYMKDAVKLFIEVLREEPTLREYAPYFQAMQENILQNFAKTLNEYRETPLPSTYYVLCHGDFHSKNIMFKHDSESGKLMDVMLVDFQLSYMGSIVNDLLYSYYMLLYAEQRPKFDELVYFYFNIFSTTLKKIGFKGKQPKLIELRKQLLNNKAIELFLTVAFMPMWEAARNGITMPEPEEMLADRDGLKRMYKNEYYLERLRELLPRFLHSGFFDSL